MHIFKCNRISLAISCVMTLVCTEMTAAEPTDLCKIVVTEKGTGWPVPLVELRTTNHVRFVTDNAGIIAFDLPELMGQETWFGVHGHGYEVKADAFGYHGVRLVPQRGQTLKVEVERTIIAKRLGRLTGTGLFGESQKLGLATDWQDAKIVGCDSVLNAVYRGKLFWAWGDTTLAKYPLGIFDTSSATTGLQPLKSFEPPLRLSFEYFVDDQNKPRGVAKMPGTGPTWLSGYVSLPDKDGGSKLVATYVKIKPPLEAYECGLCVWNDDKQAFEKFKVIWSKSADTPKQPAAPEGHPAFWKDEENRQWVLFGNPLPKLRCPATFEAWQDPAQWQHIEPQKNLDSVKDGKPVVPHTGSIAWNAYRQRWVTVFMESFGKPSAFGELWYAESRAPTGPWGPAIKVLSHDNYTFYNPRLHPEFTSADSPMLIFEGTFTEQFANRPQPTPRYDYNQILYRLDLDDSALSAVQK